MPLQPKIAIHAFRSAVLLQFHPRRSVPGYGFAALTIRAVASVHLSVAALRLVRLDRFERRDTPAGDGFELLLERRFVVGNQLGAVACR